MQERNPWLRMSSVRHDAPISAHGQRILKHPTSFHNRDPECHCAENHRKATTRYLLTFSRNSHGSNRHQLIPIRPCKRPHSDLVEAAHSPQSRSRERRGPQRDLQRIISRGSFESTGTLSGDCNGRVMNKTLFMWSAYVLRSTQRSVNGLW